MPVNNEGATGISSEGVQKQDRANFCLKIRGDNATFKKKRILGEFV